MFNKAILSLLLLCSSLIGQQASVTTFGTPGGAWSYSIDSNDVPIIGGPLTAKVVADFGWGNPFQVCTSPFTCTTQVSFYGGQTPVSATQSPNSLWGVANSVFILGTSNKFHQSGAPLPVNISKLILGLDDTGYLYVSTDLGYGNPKLSLFHKNSRAPGTTIAYLSGQVPNDPNLAGCVMHVQALVKTLNVGDGRDYFSLTNGLTWTVGF